MTEVTLGGVSRTHGQSAELPVRILIPSWELRLWRQSGTTIASCFCGKGIRMPGGTWKLKGVENSERLLDQRRSELESLCIREGIFVDGFGLKEEFKGKVTLSDEGIAIVLDQDKAPSLVEKGLSLVEKGSDDPPNVALAIPTFEKLDNYDSIPMDVTFG